MRFAMQATELEAVVRYFTNRAVQGLHEGWRWSARIEPLAYEGEVWGARTETDAPDGTTHQSIYVLDTHTRRGHFLRAFGHKPLPIVTVRSCDIEAYLTSRDIPYTVTGAFTETHEYKAMAAYFDDRHAARSGVHFMNHIDEGLAVLADLGASDAAWRAYVLHPFLQPDDELAKHAAQAGELTPEPYVLLLAMEYRHIANAYLSHREVQSLDEIALSPLPEVNDMLRADKVQNYKDFLIYHSETHPRRDALQRYFRNWLDKLEIPQERFQAWFDKLHVHQHVEILPPTDTTSW